MSDIEPILCDTIAENPLGEVQVSKTIKESRSGKLINAYVLKSACQLFYRNRGFIVANEVQYSTGYIADVLMIHQASPTTGWNTPILEKKFKINKVVEVECKCSLSDLTKLELKKATKHGANLKDGQHITKMKYAFGTTEKVTGTKDISDFQPDQFYFLVPTFLVKSAIEVCLKLNPNYGVLEFIEGCTNSELCIRVIRKAKTLLEDQGNHDNKMAYFKDILLRRLSNEITTIYHHQFWNKYIDLIRYGGERPVAKLSKSREAVKISTAKKPVKKTTKKRK